ncbi:calmodulin-binding transcription activator 6-like protein [Tanacetum coccineum]
MQAIALNAPINAPESQRVDPPERLPEPAGARTHDVSLSVGTQLVCGLEAEGMIQVIAYLLGWALSPLCFTEKKGSYWRSYSWLCANRCDEDGLKYVNNLSLYAFLKRLSIYEAVATGGIIPVTPHFPKWKKSDPVTQYGATSVGYCDCNPEFTIDDPAAVVTVKPATKQTVENIANKAFFRGFQENIGEERFFQASRKQAEERVERSVVRVQAMFRSKRAKQEYRKMKLEHNQASVAAKELEAKRVMVGLTWKDTIADLNLSEIVDQQQ